MLRHQRQAQGIGAVGAAEHMLGAAEFRQLALELGDFGTEDKAAVIDDPPDRLVHPRPDMAPLGAEIDELDRLRRTDHDIGHQTISSMRSGPASR